MQQTGQAITAGGGVIRLRGDRQSRNMTVRNDDIGQRLKLQSVPAVQFHLLSQSFSRRVAASSVPGDTSFRLKPTLIEALLDLGAAQNRH
jgi:hypothetical protein